MIHQGYKLKLLLKERNIKQEEFAMKAGVSRTYLLSVLEKMVLPKEYIELAEKVLNISVDILNQEVVPKGKVMQKQLSRLGVNQTAVAEPTTEYKSNAKHMIAELEGGRPNMYIVPVKAFGGFLTGYENTVYMKSLEKAYFPFVRGTCFGFEVDGVSMMNDEKERSYRPGSWVVCTPIDNFSWLVKNKDYVFQCIDGIILKTFDRIEGEYAYLSSLNQEYDTIKMHLKKIKVIYHIEMKMQKP